MAGKSLMIAPDTGPGRMTSEGSQWPHPSSVLLTIRESQRLLLPSWKSIPCNGLLVQVRRTGGGVPLRGVDPHRFRTFMSSPPLFRRTSRSSQQLPPFRDSQHPPSSRLIFISSRPPPVRSSRGVPARKIQTSVVQSFFKVFGRGDDGSTGHAGRQETFGTHRKHTDCNCEHRRQRGQGRRGGEEMHGPRQGQKGRQDFAMERRRWQCQGPSESHHCARRIRRTASLYYPAVLARWAVGRAGELCEYLYRTPPLPESFPSTTLAFYFSHCLASSSSHRRSKRRAMQRRAVQGWQAPGSG